jgi:hypothetical protein
MRRIFFSVLRWIHSEMRSARCNLSSNCDWPAAKKETISPNDLRAQLNSRQCEKESLPEFVLRITQRTFLFPAEAKFKQTTAGRHICLEIYGLFARLSKSL